MLFKKRQDLVLVSNEQVSQGENSPTSKLPFDECGSPWAQDV